MLAAKKHNKRPQLAFILWEIIQRHIQNRSKFHIHRWTNVSTQSQLFQVRNDHFQTGCYYRQVVISFLIWNLQKLSMSKEKLRLVGSSCMTPPWKWPFYTRNAMIMWILMLIGVSETFFNFKYNVALFLKVYIYANQISCCVFQSQAWRNVALPIFLVPSCSSSFKSLILKSR